MMRVRTATLDDAHLLAELNQDVQQLHVDALPQIYKPIVDLAPVVADFQNRVLSGTDWQTFIAEVDGQPAGYACVVQVQRSEHVYAQAQSYLYLDQISVKPAFQRHGCGQALMEAVCTYARAQGLNRVRLDTMAFNQNAVAFYAHQGFQMYKHTMELDLSAQKMMENV